MQTFSYIATLVYEYNFDFLTFLIFFYLYLRPILMILGILFYANVFQFIIILLNKLFHTCNLSVYYIHHVNKFIIYLFFIIILLFTFMYECDV